MDARLEHTEQATAHYAHLIIDPVRAAMQRAADAMDEQKVEKNMRGASTAVAETIIGHQGRSFKFTYIHLSDQDLVREIAKLEYPILD